MKIADLAGVLPLPDVYELDPTHRYLLVLSKATMPAGTTADAILKAIGPLVAKGSALLVIDDPQDLAVFDLEKIAPILGAEWGASPPFTLDVPRGTRPS